MTDAVRSALRATFGTAAIEALRPVSGGISAAATVAATVGGRRYLVRVEGPPSPLRNPHQHEAMRIAAAAGIAPPVHHIDEAAGVAVMDFVDARPLTDLPPATLAAMLGKLLAQVQALPLFPVFIDYPDITARLWAHVCRTGLFAPAVLDAPTELLARIRAQYAQAPGPRMSSHVDPVPRNILFDGTRLWLIDWESACRNDPLVDVAIMLDNLAPTPDLAGILLESWLGHPPDAELLARLTLVRALSRLYYAGVLLSAPATKHDLGKAYLAAFLHDTVPPGLG